MIGEVVVRTDGQVFRSGSGYDIAGVIISENPLVVVTEGGNMRFQSTITESDLRRTGIIANKKLVNACMRRLKS